MNARMSGHLMGPDFRRPDGGAISHMMKMPDRRCAAMRRTALYLGLAAAAVLAFTASSGQRADALSLINPAAAPTAKTVSGGLTTEVKGGGLGGGGGGGGGYHGGG